MKSDVETRLKAKQQPDPAAQANGPRLGSADARAVDLLLETAMDGGSNSRKSTDSGGSAAGSMTMSGFSGFNGFSGSSGDGVADRVDAADRLLRLLDHLPAGEPPSTLVASTLRRVEEARGTRTRTGAAASTGTTATTPGAAPAAHSPEAPEGA